jgi:hypothetical protein
MQMVLEDGDQVGPERIERARVEDVHHRQPLGQGPVAQLRGHPQGEVVRVRVGLDRAPQHRPRRVGEQGLVGRLGERLEQRAGVSGLGADELLHRQAAMKNERDRRHRLHCLGKRKGAP